VKRTAFLAVAAALAAGCHHWKTEPDVYRIDCNVPFAKVFVYDEDKELLCTQVAGEFFAEFDEDGYVEVKAPGYYAFSGPVSELKVNGQKSWYCELRKRNPGDEEPK
jgi:hypothetical protein